MTDTQTGLAATEWGRPSASGRPWQQPHASRRVMVATVAGGLVIDLVMHASGVGVGAAALPLLLAALLWWAGAWAIGRRWVLLGLPLLAPWLAVRANPTLQLLDLAACFGLLLVTAAGGSGVAADEDTDGGRSGLQHLASSAARAPRYLAGTRRRTPMSAARARAVTRGVLVATPVVLVVVALLASADENFAALFDGSWFGRALPHVAWIAVGGLFVAALARAASTKRRLSTRFLTIPPTEASVVLAALDVVLAVFVAARLLGVRATTHPTDLADQARAGFFQLVAVVVITVGVMSVVRRFAPFGPRLRSLALALGGLTVALVVIAIIRLDRYRDEFGLTELRLSTTWFSVWLGVVVVVVGASYLVRGLPWLRLVEVSAIVGLVAWNGADPDRQIATTNLERAAAGERFDPAYVAGLSADAWPTIGAWIERLPDESAAALVARFCAGGAQGGPDGLAWNRARAEGADVWERLCGTGS